MHSGISRAGPGARSSTARLGMRGGVHLRAELVAGRTRITELTCHPPLQVLRAHHVDPDRPDRASVILASPAGGILQGDELTIDIRVGPGAHLRVGTQSATRIYRAPAREARQVIRLEVDGDGSLQYLPDPLIPYAGSRFCSDSTFIVSDDGRLTAWEIVAPGRAARGEIHAFERFESVVEIARPDGTLLATDAVVLDPRAPIADIGALGGHRALGTLYVVGSGAQPRTAARRDRFGGRCGRDRRGEQPAVRRRSLAARPRRKPGHGGELVGRSHVHDARRGDAQSRRDRRAPRGDGPKDLWQRVEWPSGPSTWPYPRFV